MPDSELDPESKEKSERPFDSHFVQQSLPTIRPILDTATIIPTLFFISIIFIPLGIGIWLYSHNIGEVVVEYTHCLSLEEPSRTCFDIIANETHKDCNCLVNFEINDDLKKENVYMYYYLTNHYYQNHLDYYTSKDENQLRGKIGTPSKIIEPADKCKDIKNEFRVEKTTGKFVLPCGALANYMFSDSIELYHNNGDQGSTKVPLLRTGISLESDREKFKNPEGFNQTELNDLFAKPPSWKKSLWELDPTDEDNNGLQNEDFMVWMKVAALPDFRKLYRIVNTTQAPYEKGLPSGSYSLKIDYNYNVKNYEGTKSIIFITTSMIGGQNHFLAIAYLTVGGVCLFLCIAFLGIHLYQRYEKKTGYTLSKCD